MYVDMFMYVLFYVGQIIKVYVFLLEAHITGSKKEQVFLFLDTCCKIVFLKGFTNLYCI